MDKTILYGTWELHLKMQQLVGRLTKASNYSELTYEDAENLGSYVRYLLGFSPDKPVIWERVFEKFRLEIEFSKEPMSPSSGFIRWYVLEDKLRYLSIILSKKCYRGSRCIEKINAYSVDTDLLDTDPIILGHEIGHIFMRSINQGRLEEILNLIEKSNSVPPLERHIGVKLSNIFFDVMYKSKDERNKLEEKLCDAFSEGFILPLEAFQQLDKVFEGHPNKHSNNQKNKYTENPRQKFLFDDLFDNFEIRDHKIRDDSSEPLSILPTLTPTTFLIELCKVYKIDPESVAKRIARFVTLNGELRINNFYTLKPPFSYFFIPKLEHKIISTNRENEFGYEENKSKYEKIYSVIEEHVGAKELAKKLKSSHRSIKEKIFSDFPEIEISYWDPQFICFV